MELAVAGEAATGQGTAVEVGFDGFLDSGLDHGVDELVALLKDGRHLRPPYRDVAPDALYSSSCCHLRFSTSA